MAWPCWPRRCCGRIRSRATCSYSAAGAARCRHSTYGFRFARVAYRWHPLFGRILQVSPFRRGKALTFIYTDERPDLGRELPNWMFDAEYCSGMTLGRPEISIDGLNELAAVLASLGANRKRGAQSRPPRKKERDSAEKPVSQSCAARSGAGASNATSPSEPRHERVGRSSGRPSAGGAGSRSGPGRRG
jgi:hypothetical protein